jgi:endonuclease/exonuclease/phosphatase family metal-dependent hydrolase
VAREAAGVVGLVDGTPGIARESRVRIATYNVHKCRGLDARVRPERIAKVVAALDADVVAVQEIFADQAEYLAKEIKYSFCFGENRKIGKKPYGNATLSRLPLGEIKNYDLTHGGRERRGVLRSDVRADGSLLHLFNVHLGTAFLERRYQGRELIGPRILAQLGLTGPRIIVGDFNEWTRGLCTNLMSAEFAAGDLKRFSRSARSYPGILPMLKLDHIYFDRRVELKSLELYRSRTALIASDHLPLVAEFKPLA